MSTAGQAAGGVLGAVAGFFIGGPKGALYGAEIGLTIGGYLDPPKGPVKEGPRLSDLTVQTSTYGAVIPRGYGTFPVVGNIFWLENNALKETVKKTKSGGKGGGSKTTTKTYSYSATFAIGLLDCTDGTPIAGVRRIWIGGRLWYDAGASDLATVIASNQVASTFTLHTGSTTQAANARMQATLGVANTPAYRGLAYIVFNDLPLAPYGNSLVGAQITVEVVREGNFDLFPLISEDISPVVYQPAGFAYTHSPCYISLEDIRFYVCEWNSAYPTSSTYSIYDFRVDTHSVSPSYPISLPNPASPPKMLSDNPDRFWPRARDHFSSPFGYTPSSGNISEVKALIFACGWEGLELIVDGAPAIHSWMGGKSRVGVTDGEYCYTTELGAGSAGAYIKKYDTSLTELASITVPATVSGEVATYSGGAALCVYLNELWYFHDVNSPSTRVFTLDLNLSGITYRGRLPPMGSVGATSNGIYLKIIDGVIIRAWSNDTSDFHGVQFISLEKINAFGVPLSSIVEAECLKSRLLTAGDIDTSLLTQNVRGYRIGSVAAIRAGLEQPQAAWPFDVIQHGYTIKFKPRGSASVATIPAIDLDARSVGEKPGVSITNTREMDSVLPRRVSLSYMDVNREYNDGQQYAERLSTDSVNMRAIDLAIVMTDSEAAAIVEVLLYIYWLERYDLQFSLPPIYAALEPGDTITINATEATYVLRLTSITYAQDGRLECSAKYGSSAIYASAALGAAGQSTGITLGLAGDSQMELLDIPTLDDALNRAGYPVAMAGYLAGWPGGVVYRSDDGGQTWLDLQGFSSPGAMIGQAKNTIPAPSSVLMDTASVLSAVFGQGSLSSVSELALLSGSNYFAYGAPGRWEIIGVKTCTLQADGSYLLQNILRAQQGTEWASGLHAVGDKVILLDASLAFVAASVDAIGLAKKYRGVTVGRALETASDQAFTYSAVNLKCLSPVYLNGSRHPTTNDWTLTWIRRTRVGGAWRDYVDASLGEASESYDVEIYSSNTYTTIKRTLTGLASATATYTSAQQVTDFGSNQPTLYLKIYQLSATIGRGYPLTTSIAR